MPARWRYLLGEVGIGLRRNLLMTVATILTVTVTVTLLGTALLVQRQVAKAEQLLYTDIEVSIFLQDDISPEQQQALEADLRAQPVVADVIYESKEQAFENAQELFADEPAILQDLSPEVLPASFRVQLTDPEEFGVIASLFDGRPGIDSIRDQREVLDQVFAIMGTIRGFVFAIGLIVAIAAIALVATTIRLTAFARREQTAIMKLVGATNWYVRLPFVIEGVAASTIGALSALLLLALGLRAFLGEAGQAIAFLPLIDTTDLLAVSPLLVIGSVVTGGVVSVLALRRFLAV